MVKIRTPQNISNHLADLMALPGRSKADYEKLEKCFLAVKAIEEVEKAVQESDATIFTYEEVMRMFGTHNLVEENELDIKRR